MVDRIASHSLALAVCCALISPGFVQGDEHSFFPTAETPRQPATSLSRVGPADSWWVRTDYMMWWTKGTRPPALVTTSPDGTARSQAGVLGQSGTRILTGGQPIGNELRHGGRLAVGHWLDDSQTWGLEAVYVGAGGERPGHRFSMTSNGSPILMRPFFNSNLGQEDAELVAFLDPDPVVAGRVTVESTSEMHSLALSVRHLIAQRQNHWVELVGGYRYFRYREGLQIVENLVSTDVTGTLIPLGTTLDLFDRFDVENDFHGGEIGLATQCQFGSLWIESLAKIGVGNVHKTLRIDGATTVATPPPGATSSQNQGGLLALPSNMGSYAADDFAVLPEFGIRLRLDLTDRISATFGYSLVYLDNLWRVGDQIDRRVDTTQLTNLNQGGAPSGQLVPTPLLRDTEFWAQGMNFGLVFWLP